MLGDDRQERRALHDLTVLEAVEILGITALAAKVDRLADLIHNLKETLVATVDQLTADFTTYQGDVTSTLTTLQGNIGDLTATVEDLKNQLANVQIPAAAQAAIDNLDAQVQAADATIKSAPAPVTGDGSNPGDGTAPVDGGLDANGNPVAPTV